MGPVFRRIGQGFCGTVWASPTGPGDDFAIKREDGGPGRSLHNDYEMHLKILTSLSGSIPKVYVPGCHEYVFAHHQDWWDKQLSNFPEEFQVPCNALVSERIPPFPKDVRETLIEEYCPSSLRPKIESIKSSESNQDCLIRPYLGRRRRLEKHSKYKSFSLRNYPLHVDQVEELKLDGKLYASIMAETLAHLYWRANVDANDVEFVLAPPREAHTNQLGARSARSSTIGSEKLGEHVIWILDFDCCRQMTLDEKGVEQAVAAFYRNDPYYPRPGRDNSMDQTLWEEFKHQFLQVSEAILGEGSPEARLPALWVDLVEQRTSQSSSPGAVLKCYDLLRTAISGDGGTARKGKLTTTTGGSETYGRCAKKGEIATNSGKGQGNTGTNNGVDNVLEMLNEISSSLQALGNGRTSATTSR